MKQFMKVLKAGISLLKHLTEDPDSSVRMTVARAAGEIGGEAGLSLLNHLVQDPDEWVRETVAEVAEQIGVHLHPE